MLKNLFIIDAFAQKGGGGGQRRLGPGPNRPQIGSGGRGNQRLLGAAGGQAPRGNRPYVDMVRGRDGVYRMA